MVISSGNTDYLVSSACNNVLDTGVSAGHLSPFPFRLQICTDMLSVCAGSSGALWSIEGWMACYQENSEVPSLSSGWVRSHSLAREADSLDSLESLSKTGLERE